MFKDLTNVNRVVPILVVAALVLFAYNNVKFVGDALGPR